MRLPRDLSGHDLIKLLRRFDYKVNRQVGSHVRLESNFRGHTHHVTIPDHPNLRLGTLHAILSEIAAYLEIEQSQLEKELFTK